MLNLHADTFIALGAITSLCSMALFFSYAIILGVVINLRLTTKTTTTGGLQQQKEAAFSLGRWGLPVNIYAMAWTCYMMIWLPFPTELPVTAESMNYCIVVFGTVMIGATTAWFAWAKHHWAGPNQAIVDYVLQHDDKE